MELISTHHCMTRDVGVHGNLFGGIMLSWVDSAGAIYAMKTARSKRMVTLKMSEVLFKNPVKVNDVIRLYAETVREGNTSLTIKVVAVSLGMENGQESVVCETDMVFVNIDENGRPTAIKKDEPKCVTAPSTPKPQD